jgi:hypothetical protein
MSFLGENFHLVRKQVHIYYQNKSYYFILFCYIFYSSTQKGAYEPEITHLNSRNMKHNGISSTLLHSHLSNIMTLVHKMNDGALHVARLDPSATIFACL